MTRSPRSLGPRAAAIGLILVAGLVLLWWLPFRESLIALVAWVAAHPVGGRVAFVAAFVVCAILLVPASLLVMSGGFLFGPLQGILIVSVATLAGALASLLVARGIGRHWVAARLHASPRFAALDQAVQQRGFLVVFLTRLSMVVPYGVLNYAYGLSGISLWPFALGTWLGMLPAVALYVYIGAAAHNLDQLLREGANAGAQGAWLAIAGMMIAATVVLLLHRTASRLLDQAVSEEGPQ